MTRSKSRRASRTPASFRLRGNQSGAAYVLALTTLIVGITLSLAMLRSSVGYFMGEDTRTRRRAASNLAEAGADYAFYQIHYKGAKLPYSADVSLTTGGFHVDVTDDGNRDRSTMLITSTGTCGAHKYVLKKVTLGLLPYQYAWCEQINADDGNAVDSSGTGRGMRTNGRIKLDSLWTDIANGGWAATTVTTNGTVTPMYPNSPLILFPAIDTTYYNSIASFIYNSDTSFVGPWLPGGTAVVLVKGKVWLRGCYAGNLTFVATGDVTITDSLWPNDSSSSMAIITPAKITVQSAAGYVRAAMYCHKSDNTGLIALQGAKTVVGSVAGDSITTDHDVDIDPDSQLTLNLLKQLRMPGL